MNNSNDAQHSNMQQHNKKIPPSCEQEENLKQIPIHRNIGKLHERNNSQLQE